MFVRLNFSSRFLFTYGRSPGIFITFVCCCSSSSTAIIQTAHSIVFISNSDCKQPLCNGHFAQSRLRNILLLVGFLWEPPTRVILVLLLLPYGFAFVRETSTNCYDYISAAVCDQKFTIPKGGSVGFAFGFIWRCASAIMEAG